MRVAESYKATNTHAKRTKKSWPLTPSQNLLPVSPRCLSTICSCLRWIQGGREGDEQGSDLERKKRRMEKSRERSRHGKK
jgi:hypothetical protein